MTHPETPAQKPLPSRQTRIETTEQENAERGRIAGQVSPEIHPEKLEEEIARSRAPHGNKR